MGNGRFGRRGHAGVMSVVVGMGLAIALAPPAAALHLEQYIEVAQCQPATSQTCPQVPEVKFSAGPNDHLQAQFTANGNHCSDIEVRFLVDKYPQGDWLRVGPGQTVSSPSFDRSGDHVLGVAARGVDGGCNTGTLSAWGGTVRLDSPDVVGPAPKTVPCKWSYTGAVNINQDNGIRVSLDQWHDLTALGPVHLYAPGASVESNRGVVLGAGGDGTEVSFSVVWYDKAGRRAEGNDYTGSIDPDGTLRGTTVNDAGVTNEWVANEHWTCK